MNDAPDAPGYWGTSDQQYQPYRPYQPAQGPDTPAQATGVPGGPGAPAQYGQHEQYEQYGAGDPGHRTGHSQQPPVYWDPDAEETQVMPPVPADPGPQPAPPSGTGSAEGPAREPGRLSGPLFRDEQPGASEPGASETVVLRAITDDAPPAPAGGPYPGAAAYPGPSVPPVAAGHPGAPGGPVAGQPFLVPSSPPGQETPLAQPDPQPQPAQRKQRGGRNLQAAIGVGVGLGAVIIASLFVVKALFLVVVIAAVSVGVWELTSRLAERKEIKAPLIPLVAGGIAMVATGYWSGIQWAAASLALTGLAVMVWRMAEPPEDYLRDITAGIFTAFYVPFLATFVAMMLAADDGPQRIVLFLIVTVCSDTGAYAVGYKFGKHKLAPTISPGKTREGLAGGIGLSMLAGALLMELIIDGGSWWQGLILGGCAAVTATLGDLGESMIKRDLGIKDMGTLLPGHGGIMDRLDSLLPTAPVVWLLLAAFVGS
ncbi:phosphatidate cytidylyltransferase [Kitasatospora misakiensis]|uniref:Phosphatidate cytidylyltransferase n=1 Tax=Kitasatospora misakiensis TaxID=67330 RepID=A0ABW0XE13_9ACTN